MPGQDLLSQFDSFASPAPKPAPKQAGAGSSLLDSFDSFAKTSGAPAPGPIPPRPKGYDEEHPILSKLLDFGNEYIAKPVNAVKDNTNASLADLVHVFSHPTKDYGTGPEAGLSAANEGLQNAGHLVNDVANVATSPVQLLFSPLSPIIEPWTAAAGNFLKAGAGGTVKPELEDPAEGSAHRFARVLQTPGAVTTGNENEDAIYDFVGNLLPMLLGEEAVKAMGAAGPPTVEGMAAKARQGVVTPNTTPDSVELSAKQADQTIQNAPAKVHRPFEIAPEIEGQPATMPGLVEGKPLTPDEMLVRKQADELARVKERLAAVEQTVKDKRTVQPEPGELGAAGKPTPEAQPDIDVADKRRIPPQEGDLTVAPGDVSDKVHRPFEIPQLLESGEPQEPGILEGSPKPPGEELVVPGKPLTADEQLMRSQEEGLRRLQYEREAAADQEPTTGVVDKRRVNPDEEVPKPAAASTAAGTAEPAVTPKTRADELRQQLGERPKLVNRARAANMSTFTRNLSGDDELYIYDKTGLSPEEFWKQSRSTGAIGDTAARSEFADRDGRLAGNIEALPDGVQIEGWEKDGSTWVKGKKSLTSAGLVSQLGAEKVMSAARFSEAQAEQPVPSKRDAFPEGEQIGGVDGNKTTLKTASGQDHPAQYRVVEMGDVQASHSGTDFSKNENYPQGVQERPYESDEIEQGKVVQNATQYDPSYTVNSNPDAVNGPPMVTKEGMVLGGNSRVMTLQRLYAQGRGDLYKGFLERNAASFGIDPKAVGQMDHPVLVREVPTPATIDEGSRMSTELNRTPTGALNATAQAVTLGKKLTGDTVTRIGGMLDELSGPDKQASIADLLRARPNEVLALLQKDGAISPQQVSQFVEQGPNGLQFTDQGKATVADAMLGSVIDDYDVLRRTPPSIKAKIESMLGDLMYLKSRGDGPYNLIPAIKQALEQHFQASLQNMSVDELQRQGGLFGSTSNPVVDAIAQKLTEPTADVKKAFRSFTRDARFDVPGQGIFGLLEPPDPIGAFNHAFSPKDGELALSPEQFQDGVEQPKAQETQATQEESDAEEEESPAEKVESNAGAELMASDKDGEDRPGGVYLHSTPIPYLLKRTGELYDKYVGKPVSQWLLDKGVTKRPAVDRADPELAQAMVVYDNFPTYIKAKTQQIIDNVLKPLNDSVANLPESDRAAAARDKERLFVLMADADSRENLRINHPSEYKQAANDPAIRQALDAYKPYEQELTDARQQLGGQTLDTDYLRRVYDEYTAGVNGRGGANEKSFSALDRVVNQQGDGGPSRQQSAEYYYKNGLHELGPSFGSKYAATMSKLVEQKLVENFSGKATWVDYSAGDQLPPSIDYAGKTYYRDEDAAAGVKNPEFYGQYDPTVGKKHESMDGVFLGPKPVVDSLNGLDRGLDSRADGFKRFFQENVVSFGLGIPHIWNIARRVANTVASGVYDPRSWPHVWKVMFDSDLRQRGINGLNDPAFDNLAQHGAIKTGEDQALKQYMGGNFNPANWSQVLTRPGHDLLFKPDSFGGFGGVDQRARLYISDYLKEQNPKLTDAEISSTVNQTLGDYNRANWSERQKMLSKFMLFPGWDMSSVQWVLQHPIKSSLAPAFVVWMMNQAGTKLGVTKDQDANDVFNIHVGERVYGSNLLNEPLGRKLGRPALAGLQSLAEGNSAYRAAADATKAIPQAFAGPVDMLRPDLAGALEEATRSQVHGGDIVKRGDYSTPGDVLPNKGMEDQAIFALKKLIPQVGRLFDRDGKIDLASFIGGNLGVTNYKDDDEKRVQQMVGRTTEAEQTFGKLTKSDPQKAAELLQRDPDTVVYSAFAPTLRQAKANIARWDQVKEQIVQSSLPDDQKKHAMEMWQQGRDADVKAAAEIAEAIRQAVIKVRERRDQSVLPHEHALL